MRDELADKERAFDPAFLPLFGSGRKCVDDGVRGDEEYGGGERFVAGENRKVQLGVGAEGGRGEGIEKRGGVEVALVVRRLADVGLRCAQFGFAGGHGFYEVLRTGLI